tara:strand:- start:29 stop:808 length:780 start_codon:yes stop_codon:yes gene_type:complete
MKKLLLLSALLIFACSSDDEGVSTTEKQLLSIELFNLLKEDQCFEGENGSFEYENGKVVRLDYQHYFYTGCSGGFNYDFDDTEYREYLHLDNKIIYTRSYDGIVQEFLTNPDGTAFGLDYSDEGYLNGANPQQWEWLGGNLVNISTDEGDNKVINYSDIDDRTGYLGLALASTFYGPLDLIMVSMCQMGLFGRGTAKLPSSVIYNDDDDGYLQLDYSYTLDDDGYPIYIYIDYVLFNSSAEQYAIQTGQQATLKLTYTN